MEKNGGRVEKRLCRATDSVAWLSDLPLWAGLKTIFSITRTTTTGNGTTEETSFYISSLDCHPETLLAATRAHWKIESMHWMLDVIWDENESGVLPDNSNKTLNIFCKLALLGHKRYVASLPKKTSVKGNVLNALLNESVLFDVLMCL